MVKIKVAQQILNLKYIYIDYSAGPMLKLLPKDFVCHRMSKAGILQKID